MTSGINAICDLIAEAQRTTGQSIKVGYSIMVDSCGAVTLMREFLFKTNYRCQQTNEIDELFRVDGVPVRLRYNLPYGSAYVVRDAECNFLERQCCDKAAATMLILAISKGMA